MIRRGNSVILCDRFNCDHPGGTGWPKWPVITIEPPALRSRIDIEQDTEYHRVSKEYHRVSNRFRDASPWYWRHRNTRPIRVANRTREAQQFTRLGAHPGRISPSQHRGHLRGPLWPSFFLRVRRSEQMSGNGPTDTANVEREKSDRFVRPGSPAVVHECESGVCARVPQSHCAPDRHSPQKHV